MTALLSAEITSTRSLSITDSLGVSDHKLINLELKDGPIGSRLVAGGIMRATDYNKTTAFLEQVDWAEFHMFDDPD